MPNVELRELSSKDGLDIYDMLQEIPMSENNYGNAMHGATIEQYHEWLICREQEAKQTSLIDGWKVPSTKYWLYVDGKPVGIGDIRHFLTDALRQSGGNIGYTIRPSERRKGYGTILLRQLLEKAKDMGLEKVLITILPENQASISVAKANGGIIIKQNEERLYIWIPLIDYSEVIIETNDLILKKAKFEDWVSIYNNLWRYEESAKFMLWKVTKSEEEAKERMYKTIDFEKIEKYALLVYLKETGEAIGFAGMREVEKGVFEETGIAVGPDFVHKGFGKQILNALVDEAKRCGATKFLASSRVQNLASHCLQISCGFRLESYSEEKEDPRTGEKYVVENNMKLLV